MRVVVAEDAGMLRAAVVRLLIGAGVDVVAAVGDLPALLAAAAEHHPDVVITDMRMPPGFSDEGLQAAVALQSTLPGTGVLVFSQRVEPAYAERLLDSPGGRGYLLKDRVADLESFLAALDQVAAGGVAVDQDVVDALLRRRRSNDLLASLTPREREVLALMAQGRSNASISAELALSPKTVDRHIGQIFVKLGLEPASDEHRRVRAVLTWLSATQG
ncbi:MAG TPA: response regulator transcription factor [Mycobacteriales bacterium]|nr:response regulator transcription factor [Mycobacteriales bacterium]